MSRFSLAYLAGTAALALTAAVTPAATADVQQGHAQIENSFYHECLVPASNETLELQPCDTTSRTLWYLDRDDVAPIRNNITGKCLEDVDTNDPWGAAVTRPCDYNNPRQLWGVLGGNGLIQNLDTGRFLKANHHKDVYTGDSQAYYPMWDIG